MNIAAGLNRLGLEQYEQAFRENDVDAEVFPDLSSEDLIGLGVTSIGHRRKLLAAHPCVRRQPIVHSQGSASRDRAWSPPRGDDPDRPRPLHDDFIAFSISAQHPVAARLIVSPDDVRDVGMGNERYDAITPSGSGVGSEVDGGHCKSSCSSRPQGSSVVMSSGSSEHLCGFTKLQRCASHSAIRARLSKTPRISAPLSLVPPCPSWIGPTSNT